MKRGFATLPWIASRAAVGSAVALAMAMFACLVLRAGGTSQAAPPERLVASWLHAGGPAPSRGPALVDVADSDMIGLGSRDSEDEVEDERAGWTRRSVSPVAEARISAASTSDVPRHDPVVCATRRGRRFVWALLSRGPPLV